MNGLKRWNIYPNDFSIGVSNLYKSERYYELEAELLFDAIQEDLRAGRVGSLAPLKDDIFYSKYTGVIISMGTGIQWYDGPVELDNWYFYIYTDSTSTINALYQLGFISTPELPVPKH